MPGYPHRAASKCLRNDIEGGVRGGAGQGTGRVRRRVVHAIDMLVAVPGFRAAIRFDRSLPRSEVHPPLQFSNAHTDVVAASACLWVQRFAAPRLAASCEMLFAPRVPRSRDAGKPGSSTSSRRCPVISEHTWRNLIMDIGLPFRRSMRRVRSKRSEAAEGRSKHASGEVGEGDYLDAVLAARPAAHARNETVAAAEEAAARGRRGAPSEKTRALVGTRGWTERTRTEPAPAEPPGRTPDL